MSQVAPFLLVMAVTPHGFYRVHGIHFDREWRAVQIGEKLDPLSAIPVADKAAAAEIDRKSKPERMWGSREPVSPPALAVKVATEEEIVAFRKHASETAGKDVNAQLDDERGKRAELEARLMKLELGAKPAAADPKLEQENAALRERLAQIEALLAGLTGKPGDGAPAPAGDSKAKPSK